MKKIVFSILFFSMIFGYCVTFEVDISNAEIPDGNYIVLMNGSWNGWNWGYELTETDNSDIYTGTFCGFNNGEYQYVHSITGDFDSWSGWGLVGNPPLSSNCDFNPNDSYQNYGFAINNSDIITQLNAWNCCGVNECSNWDGCNSGALKTNLSYLYGRFEVRMKSADGNGLVSSFFTYNTDWEQDLGNLNWNEIDIEMTGNRDSSVQFTTHHPGTPNSWSYGEIIDVDFNPHQGMHDYAFEWTPEYIKWFVNGEEVYQQNESIVDDLNFSQNIMMNLWPAIWESWVGEWNEEDTPKHAYYDYVKYYEYTPNNGDYGTNNNFQFSWEDDFNEFNEYIWEDNSSGSFNGNLCSFSPLNTNFYNGHLILSLTDINEEIDCNEIDGDINYDDQLDILDIILMVDVILFDSFVDLDICQTLAIDTDCNQSLDVIDIVEFVNNILR
tara:strand:- start:739 stop:2058 length:1320 start_codon:yes stop_codon:yes gene_type:complete